MSKSITKKSLTIFILISIILGGFSAVKNSEAAIKKQFNYQGKLTDTNGVAVADGAYDIVFKLYTVAGGGSESWTESWTNAALFTSSGTTFTNDGCATGIDKMTYDADGNETSLAAGQTLWNTTKGESAVIQSVDTTGVGGFVCFYDPYSIWVTADEITNRIYIKNGLFSVMVGSITTQTIEFTSADYYLGVNVEANGEMKPRKKIGAVPYAWNANNVVGDGYIDLDNTSTGTVLTVTQSGSGDIVNIFDGATEVFTILDGGNIGIGTDSPQTAMDIRGTVENGLVGWWPMDEGNGTTVADHSINSNNGTIACPSGYTMVPGNASYGTGDFCVMKYEAKYDKTENGVGDDNGDCWYTEAYNTWDWGKTGGDCPSSWSADSVVSTPEGSPIAGITHTQALSACPSGTHIMTNDEWMTIARNAEQVASNWTGGSVGSGCLFRGNSGDTTCGYDGANPEEGTGRNARAKFTLSNGSEIYDISGNVWEHVNWDKDRDGGDDTVTDANQPDANLSDTWEWNEFTSLTAFDDLSAEIFEPSNDTWTSAQGVGSIYHWDGDSGSTLRVFLRGGNWNDTSRAGAFTLYLSWGTGNQHDGVGFRCVR